MKIKSLAFFFILIAILCSCTTDDDKSSTFEGLVITDTEGMIIKLVGLDTDDWQEKPNLSEFEKGLLDLNDQLTLPKNSPAIRHDLIQYPNPAISSFVIQCSTDKEVKFKIVLVNNKYEVLKTKVQVGTSFTINLNDLIDEVSTKVLFAQPSGFGFNVFDRAKYPSNRIIRAYYSFSVEGNEDYHYGYGDILICDNISADGTSCI